MNRRKFCLSAIFSSALAWLTGSVKAEESDIAYELKNGTFWLAHTVRVHGEMDEYFVVEANGIDAATWKASEHRPDNTVFIGGTPFMMTFGEGWKATPDNIPAIYRYRVKKSPYYEKFEPSRSFYHVSSAGFGQAYNEVIERNGGDSNVPEFRMMGYYTGQI